MRSNYLKTLKTAVLAISVLLLGVSVSVAQQQINLTAGPTAITLSDGTSVPMWGYTCGAVVSGSTATLRQVESCGGRLVARGDHGAHWTGIADQPDKQPLFRERQLGADLVDDRRPVGRRAGNAARNDGCPGPHECASDHLAGG